MKDVFGRIGVVALFILGIVLTNPGLETTASYDYTPHNPIYIFSDNDFTTENGVRNGSGTEDDPYIIEGWEIIPGMASGIIIRETTSHFIIRNVYIHSAEDTYFGVYIRDAVNGRLESSIIINNWESIYVRDSFNMTIAKNEISSNRNGLEIESSMNVTVSDNTLSSNSLGGSLLLYSSENVTVMGNKIFSSTRGIYGSVINSTITKNEVYSNQLDGIYITSSENITIFSNEIYLNHDDGIHLSTTSKANISSNRIYYNLRHGVLLDASESITIYRCYIHSNDGEGVLLSYSSKIVVFGSTLARNEEGLSAVSTGNVTIEGVFVRNNPMGILLLSSWYLQLNGNNISNNYFDGLYVGNSTNLLISQNSFFSNNGKAVRLSKSNDALVIGNLIMENTKGLYLDGSWGILANHNDFIANERQAYDDGGSENEWDIGYPGGGNHWSDYPGLDNCSGPNQSICPDPDGIGDTPYEVDADSTDRYPLMKQVGDVPSAPRNLSAFSGNGYVYVSWLPPTSDGGFPVTAYRVYRGTTPETTIHLADVRFETQFNDTDVEANTTYFYRVSAINAYGESAHSDEASGIPFGLPSEPCDVVAVGSDHQIELRWTPPQSDGGRPVTGYRIYRGNSSGSKSFIAETSNVLSYLDTGTMNGKRYFYGISAVNIAGEGPLSAEVSAVSAAPPKPPTDLWAKIGGSNLENFTISWKPSEDDNTGQNTVLGYRIFRGNAYNESGEGYVLIATLPRLASIFVDAFVGAGNPNSYFYLVCSYDVNNKTGCSPIQVGKFTMEIESGWNLISFPLAPFDKRAEIVLQRMDYDRVWAFDSLTKRWMSLDKTKPYNTNELRLDQTSGFWIDVPSSTNLTMAGYVSDPGNISLVSGWNLVGYPFLGKALTVGEYKSLTGAVDVEGVDALTPPFRTRTLSDSELMGVGKAYWVLMP